MNKKWHGLLIIEEITHQNKDGVILWKENNLTNILHNTGEKLLLSSTFAGMTLPTNYTFGLDARTTLTTTGGINGESLIYPYIVDNVTLATKPDGEPVGNGYARVNVVNNTFTVLLDGDNHYRANGPVISFLASGSGYGPVSNLFLLYHASGQDIIVSTVPLQQPLTMVNGEVINVKMGIKLVSS